MASGSFNSSSRALDVQVALQKAKRKISSLQQQVGLNETSSEGPEETSVSTWTSSKELRDSLVDMYRGNPRVNVELRQRLPSPVRQTLINCDRSDTSVSVELRERTQVSQHFQEPSSSYPSPLSNRRSISPVPPLSNRRSVSPVSPLSNRRSVSPVPPLSNRRSVSPVPPLSNRRSVSPVPPLSNRRSVSPVPPLSNRRSVSPVCPVLSSRPSGGVGEMEVDLSPSKGPSAHAESCGDDHDGSGAPRGPGSPSPRRHLVTDHSFPQDSGSVDRPPTFDQDKNISFLLKELDALRNVNQKLQEQLLQKEKELQRKQVEEELREELREERAWERPTVMLEEALSAQRDRDQALMSRLLLANEERDEALLRARRLQQAAEVETLDLLDSDMDVDELLQCICDANSVQEVQQFGSVLVQHLQLARQRRNDITAQEMKVVMGERDSSVAKCKRLEQDLIQEREQRATKDELLKIQRERDGALDDMRQLEAELQALRANCSVSSMDVLEAPPPQAASMLVQLQQLSKEKESVEAELQRCQEAEQQASDRVRRLERLVEVLRKKVGTGSLRAVT